MPWNSICDCYGRSSFLGGLLHFWTLLGMNIKLDINGINTFLKELEDDGVVKAGVSVEGPAAAYALVWEWG